MESAVKATTVKAATATVKAATATVKAGVVNLACHRL
jgi:hypothetical protein